MCFHLNFQLPNQILWISLCLFAVLQWFLLETRKMPLATNGSHWQLHFLLECDCLLGMQIRILLISQQQHLFPDSCIRTDTKLCSILQYRQHCNLHSLRKSVFLIRKQLHTKKLVSKHFKLRGVEPNIRQVSNLRQRLPAFF